MIFILESLFSALVTAVATACDQIGTGVLNLITLDVGMSGSFFSTIFSSMETLWKILVIVAMSILALNAIWQIVQIMVISPGQAKESPISVLVATGVAGVAIYFAPQIIIIAETIFNKFYIFLLNTNTGGTGFYNMFTTLQAALGGDMGINTLSTLIAAIFLIAYNFVMFLLEVVERYIVLGLLFYTSPLAFCVAGSKATRPIFTAWVRMVACQMFLMVCNVFFFRLFLLGFSGLETSLVSLQASHPGISPAAICFIWCLILYGILTIGMKMDSYLGTLGLSSAQTGRGVGAAIAGSVMAIRQGAKAAKGIGKATVYTGRAAKQAGHAIKHTASQAWAGAKNTRAGQAVANSRFGQAVSRTTQGIKNAASGTKQDIKNAMSNSGQNRQTKKNSGIAGEANKRSTRNRRKK